MTDVRVTQEGIEVIANQEVDIRVTQCGIEVIHNNECGGVPPPPTEGGGLYVLVPSKTQDTLWVTQPNTTIDVKIP